MAPYLPSFIARPAKGIRNFAFGCVQHELDEGLLKAQNAMRIAKRTVPVHEYMYSVPTKTANLYQEALASFEQMQTDNQKSKVESTPPVRVLRNVPRVHVEDTARVLRMADVARSRITKDPHRAATQANRRRELERSVTQGLSRMMPVIPSAQPESDPSAVYMESLRKSYPASDNHEERKKRTDDMVSSVFGPERVNLAVGYASGHSGCSDDPVLAEYNHNKRMHDILDHHRDWQAKVRWVEEKQQRNKAEQEAERMKKVAVYEHYCAIYYERVRKLVNAGDQFHVEIGQVLRAFENGNVQALHEAAHILITNTLDPIMALFEEMKSQILLEFMGAQELRNTWPTNSIDQVLTKFQPYILYNMPHEVQNSVDYMLQSLRDVCQPMLYVVDLINLLNEPEPHFFELKPIPVPEFEDYLAEKMGRASQQALPLPPPSLNGAPSLPERIHANIAAKKAAMAVEIEAAPADNPGLSILSSVALNAANGTAKNPTQEVKVEAPSGKDAGFSILGPAASNAANRAAKKDAEEVKTEASPANDAGINIIGASASTAANNARKRPAEEIKVQIAKGEYAKKEYKCFANAIAANQAEKKTAEEARSDDTVAGLKIPDLSVLLFGKAARDAVAAKEASNKDDSKAQNYRQRAADTDLD